MMPLPASAPPRACANQPCTAQPCAHIQLDMPGRPWAASHGAAACPSHIEEVFCGLVSWAHRYGLGGGQVTVTQVSAPPGHTGW
jgi:hypothetical protein